MNSVRRAVAAARRQVVDSGSSFRQPSYFRDPSSSQSARAASFRPQVEVAGELTRVLVEQIGAVDVGRLGDLVGHLTPEEQWGIDEALATVLGLR